MVSGRLRTVFTKIHLYVGLSFGALFIMLGLSGTMIAWRDELDAAINPDLLIASAETAMPISADTVQAAFDKLAADPQYGKPGMMMLPTTPHDVFVAWYPLKKAGNGGARSRQVMVDPSTLAIKGERVWGDPGLSREQLLPTIFQLHHFLLAGDNGRTVMGVTGMMLLFGMLAGIVLWLPRFRAKAVRQAITVRHGGSWSRFNFSLHRAVGIFAAPILVTLAFSGWYLNLPKWVTPIVAAVAPVAHGAKPSSATPAPGARVLDAGDAVRAAQAAYPQAKVTRMSFPRKPGDVFEMRVQQPDEPGREAGNTRLWLDAYTGANLGARDPLKAPSGEVFLGWLYPLHTGQAFGVPGRIFITMIGFLPLMFGVTGVLVWWKRRTGHRRHLEKTRERALMRKA